MARSPRFGALLRISSREDHELTSSTVVEQYRLLESWIKIIQETDHNTGLPICNVGTCPTMAAGG